MGKQYKTLKLSDIEFIKEQKLFYIASSSGKEVNLSPKGYDTIRVIDNNSLVFLDYPGSGNRTFRDTANNGEFTLLFNAYSGKALILRIFCTAQLVEKNSQSYKEYLDLFDEKESLVRNFFLFNIYAVETSCGDSIPYMEYKEERSDLKTWASKMDKNNKLDAYTEAHAIPPNMKDV